MSAHRTGRSQGIGLPANPRARSASRPRRPPTEELQPIDHRKAPQLRPQRSFTPLPSTPRPSPVPRTLDFYLSDTSSVTSSSNSSMISGTSSSWRRRRDEGYASSRTSIDENETCAIGAQQSNDNRSWETRDKSSQPIAEGDGGSLWDKFTTGASLLTINVSKAWATNIPTLAGEETPFGQESRLTKALKAYHIAKARDPSDLPDWLFEPQEQRHLGARDVTIDPRPEASTGVYAPSSGFPAVQAGPTVRGNISATGRRDVKDRLRIMRDAKRVGGATTRNVI